MSGPFLRFRFSCARREAGRASGACKRFAGGKTLRRGEFTSPRLKSNPGPPDGTGRTGPNFAEEIAKQLGK